MSFGKRGIEPPEKPQRGEATEYRSPRRVAGGGEEGNFKLLTQLLKILGVFAACYAGYSVILPKVLALTVGHPITGMVPPRSPEGRALRQKAIDRALALRSPEIREIEIRLDDACMPRGAQTIHTPLAQVEYWVDPESQWAPDAEDPRAQMHIKDASSYLACVARLERQRFCQPYFQAKYASQLKRYFETVRTYNGRAEQIAILTRMGREKSRREYGTDKGGDETPMESIGLDPSISAAVKNLSSDGYLSAKNFGPFGFGVPAEVAPFLQPATQRYCR